MAVTREDLEQNRLRAALGDSPVASSLLTEAALEASLASTLARLSAAHGDCQDAWVFGYGSLIWNPMIFHTEAARATVHGYHRGFYLYSRINRGTWDNPGLVLGLDRGAGSIVNIASVHGHKIIPGAFPYPVAKHGLIGLTRALGIEYAARGIRVNSISPGLILTPIAEAGFAAAPDPEAERRRQAELLPCKRIGEPEEVAYTALFLASDEARFINATDILIDGGRSQLYQE